MTGKSNTRGTFNFPLFLGVATLQNFRSQILAKYNSLHYNRKHNLNVSHNSSTITLEMSTLVKKHLYLALKNCLHLKIDREAWDHPGVKAKAHI